MASIVQPLLSIAIPTYNRAVFLDQCLSCIAAQVVNSDYPIEVIVSDNCSSDQTPEIVNKYKATGLNIKYIKNKSNKGGDYNIAQCFEQAKGKYVLILGDDDFFIKDAIKKIVLILTNEVDAGIINIQGKPYDQHYKIIGEIRNEGIYSVFTDKLEFVKKVTYGLTFISGNIINKDLFLTQITNEFYNTYLLQLCWVFNVLINSKKNIIIDDDLLGIGSTENTGGYRLYEVFGVNFNKIMNLFKQKGLPEKFITVINKELLISFFPDFIIKDRINDNEKFLKESPKYIFSSNYSNKLAYWIFIFPLLTLPNRIYKYWRYPILTYKRVQLIFQKLFFWKNTYVKKVIPEYL